MAVGGDGLRAVELAAEGIDEGLLRLERAGDFSITGDFTEEFVVPEIVDVVEGGGVEAERAGVGLVAGERGGDGAGFVEVVGEDELGGVRIVGINIDRGIGGGGCEQGKRILFCEDLLEVFVVPSCAFYSAFDSSAVCGLPTNQVHR